jgi:hypothetical protein
MYNRRAVRAFYAGLTPDSRPCHLGICPIMVCYPNTIRRMADATRADPELVKALDAAYKRLYWRGDDRPHPWARFTAGDIVKTIDSL